MANFDVPRDTEQRILEKGHRALENSPTDLAPKNLEGGESDPNSVINAPVGGGSLDAHKLVPIGNEQDNTVAGNLEELRLSAGSTRKERRAALEAATGSNSAQQVQNKVRNGFRRALKNSLD